MRHFILCNISIKIISFIIHLILERQQPTLISHLSQQISVQKQIKLSISQTLSFFTNTSFTPKKSLPMMQIKVHHANHNQKQSPGQHRQQHIRMTLQQYLQSTNLRRRINSRSKSKSKKQSSQQGESQQKHLQPPTSQGFNQTMQFFKLSQQWKAKKLFTSWIMQLKQLCRQYIKKDQEYVEVIRLVEKIAEFVKNEVQTIKKDNLLLQSYLVTEASYWPEGSNCDNQPAMNNDRLSNYIKAVLNSKSEFMNSPNKSQQVNDNENNSPQNKSSKQSHLQTHKTSTQPKSIPHNPTTTSSSHMPRPHSSSTTVKTTNQNSKNNSVSNLQKQQYIYSFKDKNILGSHNYLQRINSYKGKRNQQNINTTNFQPQSRIINEEQDSNILDVERYQDMGLLRIHSRNEEEVPRLSLMSRYDENRNREGQMENETANTQNLFCKIGKNQMQKTRVTPIQLSQMSTKQQLSQLRNAQHNQQFIENDNRPSLKKRKQKTQKIPSQSPDQFQMIVLQEDQKINQSQERRNSYQSAGSKDNMDSQHYHHSKTKQIQQFDKQSHNEVSLQTSPFILRQSPNVVSIQTPSTLRRRNPSVHEITSTKKQEQVQNKFNNPQVSNRNGQKQSLIYKSSISSYEENKRNNSRQNIMRRYDEFRKVN